MSDTMRFTPDAITVRRGETVRFVFRNEGKLPHEFVLGTKKELEEHAALMMKFPSMERDEPCMAHLPPGKTSQIVWTFNRAGEFDFACLVAGHYQAGMVGKITCRPSERPHPPRRDHGIHAPLRKEPHHEDPHHHDPACCAGSAGSGAA